jgi:peroxiredoxin
MCLISFFASACDACLTEISNAALVCDENETLDNVILISAESISRLRRVRDEYSLSNTFLYDYEGEFSKELKIDNFPFNIIVDPEMTIHQVFSGVIPPTELENIVRCQ